MFALNGATASAGLSLLLAYGDRLYSLSPMAPFLYWYAGYILITLLILALFVMHKLKI